MRKFLICYMLKTAPEAPAITLNEVVNKEGTANLSLADLNQVSNYIASKLPETVDKSKISIVYVNIMELDPTEPVPAEEVASDPESEVNE